VAHGITHQFVVFALMTSYDSFSAGSWSRPLRPGSTPSISPGGVFGETEMRDPWAALRESSRFGYHGGTLSSVSSAASSARIRFDWASKYHGSKNTAPCV